MKIDTNLVDNAVKSSESFPVNFNDVWKSIGYSTKGNAVVSLKNDLEEGVDWISTNSLETDKLLFMNNHKYSYPATRGKPEINYYLSTDGFKHFCLIGNLKTTL